GEVAEVLRERGHDDTGAGVLRGAHGGAQVFGEAGRELALLTAREGELTAGALSRIAPCVSGGLHPQRIERAVSPAAPARLNEGRELVEPQSCEPARERRRACRRGYDPV